MSLDSSECRGFGSLSDTFYSGCGVAAIPENSFVLQHEKNELFVGLLLKRSLNIWNWRGSSPSAPTLQSCSCCCVLQRLSVCLLSRIMELDGASHVETNKSD